MVLERLGKVFYWLGSGIGVLCSLLSIIGLEGRLEGTKDDDYFFPIFWLVMGLLAFGSGNAVRYIILGK